MHISTFSVMMLLLSMTRIYFEIIYEQIKMTVTRRQWVNSWVNSLWHSDTIWRQRSGSTLAQVMACCLRALSHYLNQCWLIVSEVSDIHLRASSQEITQPSITEIIWKNQVPKISFKFPRRQWVNVSTHTLSLADSLFHLMSVVSHNKTKRCFSVEGANNAERALMRFHEHVF